MRLKKRHKSGRMRGSSRHGWGARKKHMSSGHKGGKGMSGTGKGAGHKKTLITKLYGMGYFGKKGFTSRGNAKVREKLINVGHIEKDLSKLTKEFGQKDGTLKLKGYKILGDGDIKIKVNIIAKSASQSAIEKVQKAGGKLEIEKTNAISNKDKKAVVTEEENEDEA